MSDKKVSELSATTTLSITDLVMVATDNGDTTFTSKKITEANLQSQMAVFPKTSGVGIKLDTTTPVFGWRDLIGPIHTRPAGGTIPTFSAYRGVIWQYRFLDTGDEVFNEFHIPHDYVPGSPMYIHAHWSQVSAGTGNAVFSFNISYAKGYDQAPFSDPASAVATVTQAASGTPYQHMIAEVIMTSNGGSASTIDVNNIEVDGLILVRTKLTTLPTGGGAPFVHFIDIHYQSTGIPTKGRNYPDFYA